MLSLCDFNWVCISFQSWSLFWCLILCTKLIFGPILGKNGPLYPHQELSQHHEQYENVVFLVSRHDGNTKIGRFAQKNDFEPKRATLGHRGRETARRAAKRPPTGKNHHVLLGFENLMRILSTWIGEFQLEEFKNVWNCQSAVFPTFLHFRIRKKKRQKPD